LRVKIPIVRTERVFNILVRTSAVLTDVYAQHPELVEKLLATGQDTLVYTDPTVGGGGVGLSSDNKKVLDPANWRSQNVVGKVLESIRASSREASAASAADVAPPPEAKEAVISKEQQDAAKRGAIINGRRR